MSLIRFLIRTSWKNIILAVIGSIISGGSGAVLISLIHRILSQDDPISSIWIWRFVGLTLLMTLSSICAHYLSIYLSLRTVAKLRLDLSRRILNTPLRRLEKIGSPRILATLLQDVESLSSAFSKIPELSIDAAILIGGTIYLGYLSWQVLLLTLGFSVLGILSHQLLTGSAQRKMKAVREEQDDLFQQFHTLTEGIKELKLHRGRRLGFLFEGLQPITESLWRRRVTVRVLYIVFSNWTRLLIFALIGILMFVLPVLQDVDSQTLMGYVLFIFYFIAPVNGIMFTLPLIYRAKVALQKVEDLGLLLAESTDITDVRLAPEQTANWQSLALVGVSHTYHREKEDQYFTIGPIDLTFYPGELVFLAGGNGSGKTTLAKILTGLYPPEAGEIHLDGKAITQNERDDYRQLFSAVFTDFYLFESLLGLQSPNLDAQAKQYLVELQLDHKVKIEDGILSTTQLSQGQRKRLALLTAYLEDRSFYVFDEWAADQDPLFKEIFYKQLLPQLKRNRKAVLVISHDDRYYDVADRIIRLDYGQLISVTPAAEYDHWSMPQPAGS